MILPVDTKGSVSSEPLAVTYFGIYSREVERKHSGTVNSINLKYSVNDTKLTRTTTLRWRKINLCIVSREKQTPSNLHKLAYHQT